MQQRHDAPRSTAAPSDLGAQAVHFLQLGIHAAGRGDADEAIDWFRQAIALCDDLVPAQANLGLLLVALGRPAEAEPHLQVAASALPNDATLANALGVAQEARGRLADAERSLRAALAAQPGLAEAHANLGNVLRRQGRLDEALASCRRAVELRPDFAVARYNLGVLLQERDEHPAAIAQYRAALELREDYIEALNNLGSSLRHEGFIDEARATFERVLEARPDQIESHCNLAPFKTYKPGDPHVERLQAMQDRVPSLPESGRVRYWFTLGKMLEDVGRFDDAFAAYAEGNRAKHAMTPWDEADHLDRHRRIVATFPRERMAAATPADAAFEGPVPVFIVGMPRSGTSLLEQVLATLPTVHGAGEITALAEVLQSADQDVPPGSFSFPETLGAWSDDALRRLGMRYVEKIRALAPSASHVVDKLPANFTHLGLIHLMLPNARIVHAMRDPMDSCFSCFSRLFMADNLGFAYDLGTVGRYWASYHELMRHWHHVLPAGRILDVPYEAMVADFENQARRVVDYLGLPWDDRCLGFHANQRIVKTASVAQVRKPIYKTSVARWKAFESHLGPLMDAVGRYRPGAAS